MKKAENKSVFLPSELYDRIKGRVKTINFSSVDEHVTFVLQEVLREKEEVKKS